jgi:hypothetical protein
MIYQINVKGELDQSWIDWLGGVEITSNLAEDGAAITTLTVDVIDQPALFGILDRIRDLNLVLINVIDKEGDIDKEDDNQAKGNTGHEG